MSRIAKAPVSIPSGVEVKVDGQTIHVKGPKGELDFQLHNDIQVQVEDNQVVVSEDSIVKNSAQAGTARAIINNMLKGVNESFSKTLKLVGVGYRAQVSGSTIKLSLGFSHPVDFALPKGVTAQAPTPTELILSSVNKQQVGQIAANIRKLRKPEPYKGKGVRYADEVVRTKEVKKK